MPKLLKTPENYLLTRFKTFLFSTYHGLYYSKVHSKFLKELKENHFDNDETLSKNNNNDIIKQRETWSPYVVDKNLKENFQPRIILLVV